MKVTRKVPGVGSSTDQQDPLGSLRLALQNPARAARAMLGLGRDS